MPSKASSVLIATLLAVVPSSTAAAQSLEPGEQVRVTTRHQGVTSRETGWLISITADTLTLQRSQRDSLRVARTEVIRLEHRRRDVSLGKTTGAGCLLGGAAFGGLGLIARDPDSPGIERTLAVVGFGVGCLAGGTAGLVGGFVARGPWEDVSVEGRETRLPSVPAGSLTTPPESTSRTDG